ncbi:hypothetical protein [Cytobacillus purgationiresistens]|uniref:Phage host-nuclease inhibitor protein Gam n=1 Tax=Cytobacillus purgationiresistens TaxID=863449 RepID=A0ABU0AK21_9BACI|nr:hypothetical protein [Cytobacillus purgationiresistens]MDQ0270753.1 phage host-nuclease inhibitor protein Gam [Cytobacillus purgationiresistens]
MTNKHYIADESLGGIEREFVEVERNADVGDYVIIISNEMNHPFEIGEITQVTEIVEDGIVDAGGWYISDEVYIDYKTLEPTDIVRIDTLVDADTSLHAVGRYRLVDRKAEIGEKVLDLSDGEVLEIVGTHHYRNNVVYYSTTDAGEVPIKTKEYSVLQLVEAESTSEPITVDATQASPQVLELLGNLARRVTQLETQLRDTQRNVETFAQQTEINTEAIRSLSDRTQKKSNGKTLRFEQEGLTNWRVYQDGVELKGVSSVRIKASRDDFTMYDVEFIAGVTADENGN